MELRIIAEFSQDPLWLEAFRNGGDLHSILCSKTFNIPIEDVKKPFHGNPDITYRDVQKIINFGLAYGMTKYKLADTMQIDIDSADKIINNFFSIVPKVKEFLNNLGKLGTSRGYIRTGYPYRRVRFFPNYENPNYFGNIERASKNTPIQGTNGDIIKLALINVQNEIDKNNWPVKIILAVYDEINTECREDLSEKWKSKLEEIMIESAKVCIKSIPTIVDCKISDYWQK